MRLGDEALNFLMRGEIDGVMCGHHGLRDRRPGIATSSKVKENLSVALSRDLQTSSSGRVKVVDDAMRKVFTVTRDNAVLVFVHKQPDAAYWNGVKHCASGLTSKIRVRRSPAVSVKQESPSSAKETVAGDGPVV